MSAPVLEPRSAEQLAAALHERLLAFLPGWQASPGGPGAALLSVYGQFLHALAERLNAAPDKNELAFLDLLGLDVLPAGAARAPVVFSAIPGAGNGRAPARTRLSAKGPDPAAPLVFETVAPVAVAEARLAEVVSVWPGRDAYADHTADAIGGRPFTVWDGLQPIAHELYLAHDLQFALEGQASVALELSLAPGGSEPLELEWSWWDGKSWRAFKELRPADDEQWSLDGTLGLTRSGTVRLVTDCAASKPRVVGGWSSHWLRARTVRPLAPDAERALPLVDRISLSTVLGRPVGSNCTVGLLPDAAFADALAVDATKPFQPLGPAPGVGTAFYVSCAEAFAYPGAEVEICLNRPRTSQEQMDEEADAYAADITAIIAILLGVAASSAAELEDVGKAALALTDPASAAGSQLQGMIDGLHSAAAALHDLSGLDAVAQAAADLAGVIGSIQADVVKTQGSVPDVQATRLALNHMSAVLLDAANQAADMASWVQGIVGAIANAAGPLGTALGIGSRQHQAGQIVEDVGSALLDLAVSGSAKSTLSSRVTSLHDSLGSIAGALSVPDAADNARKAIPPVSLDLIWKNDSVVDESATRQRIRDSAAKDVLAAAEGSDALAELAKLSPFDVGAAVGVKPPVLDPPSLVWEYWNGDDWRSLSPGESTTGVGDLLTSGSLTFTVPDDWEQSQVNGTPGRWLRARLESGVYGRLRIVSWVDTQTKRLNVMPVIEPRPPEVKAMRIGYRWVSAAAAPQHCLTLNDFRWEDHTEDAGWRGGTFPPFRPVADPTPALYLGFDRPLPADELGVLFDVDLAAVETGPPLDWEQWDGAAWRRLTVTDGTDALAAPGIVSVLWPGGPTPETMQVTAAEGQRIRLADVRAAAKFVARDLVWLESDGKGELSTVAGVEAEVLATEAPLATPYRQATLVSAALPRFGTPRTWLRARLHSDGDPLEVRVQGIYGNAGWATQVETVEDELLGSGNGEPRQAFFLTRTPVLSDELIEVRELEGGRAHVEYPLLVGELQAVGIGEEELRLVREPRTGHVLEVWVPWRRRDTLAFSGAHDRDYTLERTRGRLVFGDGAHGLVLPAGIDNVRARRYRSGGGATGNVPAGAIGQVLSGTLVAGVANPIRAEGGADTEPEAAVLRRGPLSVRHRRQALTAADFEALAREASPGVAVARAIERRGRVAVAIVPYSSDPLPEPSWELRREVREFLRVRSPAALRGAVSVVAPDYRLVGANAVVAPRTPAAAGPVAAEAVAALRRFFHPLTGGPDGTGWPFGRPVHLSDVAALLAALEGVDVVEDLVLVVDGSPQPETVGVPGDRLVAAGAVIVELGGVS